MERVFFGIPYFARQSAEFWGTGWRQASELHKDNIELVDILPYRTMMVDVSRNYIVHEFLKSKADWLKWFDDDNVEYRGSIRTLLDTHKTLVSGVYTKRNEKPEPLVYVKDQQGKYMVMGNYTPGEIVPVDAAGMGACLVHRSVYEDILKNYRMLEMPSGGIRTFHKDDIIGDVFDNATDENDGKVINGVLHQRFYQVKQDKPFAFYILGDGRTEDYGFFEAAKRSGHQLWVDTGVSVGHIGEWVWKDKDWREWQRQNGY